MQGGPGGVVFALGPTNTGKTYRALAAMRAHDTGMIGLPLRLLAREVYDGLTAEFGEEQVALVTGEEKRVPRSPRYWVATVEAMPLDVKVDFLAVDEIQLAAHPERGHVFTDRLLHARGLKETWFLGSDAMSALASELFPGAELRSFPRYSELTFTGQSTLGALPRRSAAIAFSAERVYELAGRLRARRGGTAIVLGALSPRARNAQVAMYQAGEVDYLVATDAIGMGLNLDLDHVALSETTKFDGRETRPLEIGEIAQIVGRAGRYQRPGTFGALAPNAFFPTGLAMALERHQVPRIRSLFYRNAELDFSSLDALARSLRLPPPGGWGKLVHNPDDAAALAKLSKLDSIHARASSEEKIRLLWDVCQIPDYRKLLVDEHSRLCEEIYGHLIDDGELPAAYLDKKLRQAERHHSDIASVTASIAASRTWNYAIGRDGWVRDARGFAERARLLEDRLSDTLHELLTSEFVERKKSISIAKNLAAEPKSKLKSPFAALSERLRELEEASEAGFSWTKVIEAKHSDFELTGDRIFFGAELVGRLVRGKKPSEPETKLAEREFPPGISLQLTRRLRAFSKDLVGVVLASLETMTMPSEPTAAFRGILYQLREGLGTVETKSVRALLGELRPEERSRLEKANVHFGERFVFLRSALKGSGFFLRNQLVRLYFGNARLGDGKHARPGFRFDGSREMALALGYAKVGGYGLRVDLVENLDRESRTFEELERKTRLVEKIGSTFGANKKDAARIFRELFEART